MMYGGLAPGVSSHDQASTRHSTVWVSHDTYFTVMTERDCSTRLAKDQWILCMKHTARVIPKQAACCILTAASIESTFERSQCDGNRTLSDMNDLELAKLAAVLMHNWHDDE